MGGRLLLRKSSWDAGPGRRTRGRRRPRAARTAVFIVAAAPGFAHYLTINDWSLRGGARWKRALPESRSAGCNATGTHLERRRPYIGGLERIMPGRWIMRAPDSFARP